MAHWKISPIDGCEHYLGHSLAGSHYIGPFNPDVNPLLVKKYGGKGLTYKATMAYTSKDGVIRFMFEAFKTRDAAIDFIEKTADKLVREGAEVTK